MVKILFTADIQVKNREKSLYRGQEKSLLEIESILKETKAEIYLAAGDFWEFATPNDSERKLIYNHLARVLAITTVKEVVFIAGNHDLEKDKKQLDTQIGFNPINIFADFVQNLDETLSSKITYLRESKSYLSKCSNIEWIAYSLEDEEKWRPLDTITKRHPSLNTTISNPVCIDPKTGKVNLENFSDEMLKIDKELSSIGRIGKSDKVSKDTFRISIYHDILRDYVDETKLPIRKEKYNNLLGINDFVGNLTLAGDIHENYKCETLEGKTFMYPGSPIQHTHNEGTFITIRETSNNIKPADTKVVKLLSVDDVNKTWITEDITLINQICYNTITFDNVSPAHAIDNLKEQLNNIYFGEEQTFIKVKLTNILLSKEMEINVVLQTLGMNHKRVQITFTYDKFIDLTKSANQEIINEIRSEVQADNPSDNPESTIDDLVLDNNKLNKLFGKVLDNYIPAIRNELSSEITEEDIRETIIKLFDEQLEQSISGSQKYNIVMENIETNGFMKLGANRIDLNIPGIVRISGTNGIGKTTLFHMLRWLLKDETFEGLKKNTKVKNTLIIFNDKKPEEDTVFVKGFNIINNTPVVITRTATRTWKKGVDLKQKQSLYWKDYIAGVEKTISVMIIKDGKEITYTGEQAEKVINIWFGDTINTIMFLNQTKILNILNLSPMELKELILNYIGVDYLTKLENNLELIKSDYECIKPKRDKESIREAIIDQKILLEQFVKDIDSSHLTIQEGKTSLDLVKQRKEQISEQQILIGNIPNLISETKVLIEQKDTEIDGFVIQEVKEKIHFTTEKPIEPDTTETKLSIVKSRELISELKTNLSKKEEQSLTVYTNLLKCIDVRMNLVDTNYTNLIDEQQKIVDESDLLVLEKLKLIQEKLFETVKKLEDVYNEQTSSLNDLKIDRQIILNEIDKLKNQINSGICKECDRPLEDDWETHKIVYQNKLNEAEKQLSGNQVIINQKTETLAKSLLLVETYRKYYNNSLSRIITVDYDNKSKVTDYCSNIASGIIEVNKQIEVIESNIKILNTQRNDKKSDFNNIKFTIVSKDINKLKTISLDETVFENDEKHYISDIEEFQDIITIVKEKILTNEKQLELVISELEKNNNQYITDFQEYQKLYDSNIKENADIELFNSGVEKHNNQKLILSSELLTLKNQLLAYENKIPEYEKINIEYSEINFKILEFENKILEAEKLLKEIELRQNTEKLKLESINAEYEAYIVYQKNKIIWKIYSNLIKTSFKDIVFEYYRNFLNNTLNVILEDVNFKLMWNNDGELYMIDFQNGFASYRPVQQSSGMETCFLGLTLIYAIHLLNIKNSISNIFIDELSGQLNNGNNLSYVAENYQALFVLLLQKFKNKTIMIVDHNINNLFETSEYQVNPSDSGSVYKKII